MADELDFNNDQISFINKLSLIHCIVIIFLCQIILKFLARLSSENNNLRETYVSAISRFRYLVCTFFFVLKIPTDNEWHDEVESSGDEASQTGTNDGMATIARYFFTSVAK